MKKIYKLLCLVLSVLLLFGLASGCGSDTSKGDDPVGQTDGVTTPAGSNTGNTIRRGTITLSFSMGDEREAYEAVAKAYMKLNPGVNVVINDVEFSSYTTWLTSQLASNSTQADVVINNSVSQYYGTGKFVDYSSYLTQENPYADGQVWMDVLEESAYRVTEGSSIYSLNVDNTQLQWFYNKEIFDELNIKPPSTWDELIEIC